MEERRQKTCYWHLPPAMDEVRLEPEGEPFLVEVDQSDESLYVTEEDGERTYLIFG
jgi:hypothetical protein